MLKNVASINLNFIAFGLVAKYQNIVALIKEHIRNVTIKKPVLHLQYRLLTSCNDFTRFTRDG